MITTQFAVPVMEQLEAFNAYEIRHHSGEIIWSMSADSPSAFAGFFAC
jgi:hypothetical protein